VPVLRRSLESALLEVAALALAVAFEAYCTRPATARLAVETA
jgi:hypothetical protein